MDYSSTPLLEMKGISKEFSGNKVLNDINFKLYPGEILGLVGENGAGKSTLMKILFGMDEIRETGGYGGDVLIDGKKVSFNSSEDAIKAGIGMVHQEFSLIPDFTVGENIVLNREPEKYSVMSELFGKRLNTLDRKEMQRRALKAIERLGVELEADKKISTLPVGYKQFTEIARELSKEDDKRDDGANGIRLLVLDEPTAVLSEHEAIALLKAMKNLSQAGIAIIFISHRLQEIIDVCDSIMVMRDGLIIKHVDKSEADTQKIASWMVGRTVKQERIERSTSHVSDEIIFSVSDLRVEMPGEMVKNVSFSVKKGEIFGLGGLLQLFATLHNRIKNIPFIIITDRNVSFYVQFKKSYHTINFDDVKQFRIISIYGSKMIAVDYKKNVMEQLFDGSNGITAKIMSYNLKKTGAAISIPTANLTMKAKDICAILNKRIDGKYPSKG